MNPSWPWCACDEIWHLNLSFGPDPCIYVLKSSWSWFATLHREGKQRGKLWTRCTRSQKPNNRSTTLERDEKWTGLLGPIDAIASPQLHGVIFLFSALTPIGMHCANTALKIPAKPRGSRWSATHMCMHLDVEISSECGKRMIFLCKPVNCYWLHARLLYLQ
jgi:hypothetical protein